MRYEITFDDYGEDERRSGNLSYFDMLLIHNSTIVLLKLSGTCSNFQRFGSSPCSSIIIGKHGAQDARDAVKIRHPLLHSRLRHGLIASDRSDGANLLFHPERLVLQVQIQIHWAVRSRQRTTAVGYSVVMARSLETLVLVANIFSQIHFGGASH
jgi:hypothetical protein